MRWFLLVLMFPFAVFAQACKPTQPCDPGRIGYVMAETTVFTLSEAVASRHAQETGLGGWIYCGTVSPQVALLGYQTCAEASRTYDFSPYAYATTCPVASMAAGGGMATAPSGGNHYQAEVNLVGALPLTLYYNSASQKRGIFGVGWSSTYERTLVPVSPTRYENERPDGSTLVFQLRDNGRWRAVEDRRPPAQMWFANGYTYLTNLPGGSPYMQEVYNSATGKLAWMVAAADGAYIETQLDYRQNEIQVYDSAWGRVMTLHTNSRGLVFEAVTPSGAKISYRQDGDDNLISTTYQATGLTRHFLYNEPERTALNNPHLLTGIAEDETRVSDITYDSQGRSVPSAEPEASIVLGSSELVTQLFLRFPVRPLTTPPPPNGTMSINQPPPGYAFPIPANRPDLRPTERVQRPGTAVEFAPPEGNFEADEAWKESCAQHFLQCMLELNPEVGIGIKRPGPAITDMIDAAEDQKSCPQTPGLNDSGRDCYDTLVTCMGKVGRNRSQIWPNGFIQNE